MSQTFGLRSGHTNPYNLTAINGLNISSTGVIKSIRKVIIFDTKNFTYNEILNTYSFKMITEKFMTVSSFFNENTFRIEPLDTILLLLNTTIECKIKNIYDDKVVNEIILKNFKFKNINNILTDENYNYTIDVEYDGYIYNNPNIPEKEKRNLKLKDILNK